MACKWATEWRDSLQNWWQWCFHLLPPGGVLGPDRLTSHHSCRCARWPLIISDVAASAVRLRRWNEAEKCKHLFECTVPVRLTPLINHTHTLRPCWGTSPKAVLSIVWLLYFVVRRTFWSWKPKDERARPAGAALTYYPLGITERVHANCTD